MFGGVAAVVGVIWVIVLGISAQSQAADLQALGGNDQTAGMTALMHILGGPAGIGTLVILLPSLCAFVYFGARLSLFTLAAADTRSFSLGRAWSLTKGAVLAIILTMMLIYLVLFLAGALAGVIGGVIGAVAQQGGQGAAVWLYIYNTRRPGDAGIAATFA